MLHLKLCAGVLQSVQLESQSLSCMWNTHDHISRSLRVVFYNTCNNRNTKSLNELPVRGETKRWGFKATICRVCMS